LLNDTTYIEASRRFAERILREGGSTPAERISLAFRLATARDPSEAEMTSMLKTLRFLLDEYAANPQAAQEFLSVGEAPHDEKLDPVETAAYGGLMNAILNLDEVENKG
jgi:hypothetical protein